MLQAFHADDECFDDFLQILILPCIQVSDYEIAFTLQMSEGRHLLTVWVGLPPSSATGL